MNIFHSQINIWSLRHNLRKHLSDIMISCISELSEAVGSQDDNGHDQDNERKIFHFTIVRHVIWILNIVRDSGWWILFYL